MRAPSHYERGILKVLELAKAHPPLVHIYHRPYYNQRAHLIGHTLHGMPVVRLMNDSIVTLPSSSDYEVVTH